MNIRNIIKLQRVQLTEATKRDYDNPYEYRLEIWHGTEDSPFHEAVYFTPIEIKAFLTNFLKLQREVRKKLNGRNSDDKGDVS